ncbi:uncharacterized protein LOC133832623 [Humulus lupulus]|uniref:uncharacterized protein LOC133832623 n=1 Tax=Humulus lupulus TaxID=3486 RepID=UPI002B40DC7A|nr:uncharacterized protein LOC133832623 [Humulus lupulus]
MQSSSLENMLKEYIVKNEAMIQSQVASLRNLENQVGQLANELKNRPHGTLPSDTENPRSMGKEHCKAVTLRSGKELEKDKTESGHEDAELPSAQRSTSAQDAAGIPQHCQPASSISKKPPSFPQRFQKQKLDYQFKKFLDMLKQLHINIPLVEALEQMPNYVKFMKDILKRKRRLGEFETVALTKECSSFLQNRLPPKMKDPGSFTIPCTIGNSYCGMALCDLGASINLMPMSVYRQLGIGEVRPTTVTLQLADRSLAYPDGKIEDVLADKEVPIILRRPYLSTGRTLIDVQKGELTMRVQNEQVTFNVFKAMRFPDEVEECSVVSVVDSLASKELENNFDDPLDRLLMFDSHAEDEDEYLAWIEASSQGLHTRKHFESLELSSRSFTAPKPSVEEPPELELKALPSHLRYAYLGKYSTLPVIFSAELSMEQEEKLLDVLRKFKKAIGWTIADIKGISPSLCMHKILLENSEKGSIEGQRRLNPIMKEVVKKEIIKWLDAGIIYPISDSSWVCPVQCVPKKGGITVVENEDNERIPTRTVTGWRICMDYRKLNKATRKDHFPLPFIDQMLDRLVGREYYCFLDGYSG